MALLQFYPIDISLTVINGSTAVLLTGRTPSGDKIVVMDKSFSPYFYVQLKNNQSLDSVMERLKKLELQASFGTGRITKTRLTNRLVKGEKITLVQAFVNIFFFLPKLAAEAAQWPEVESVHEQDVSVVKKYLLEKNISLSTLTDVYYEPGNIRTKYPCFNALRLEQKAARIIPDIKAFSVKLDLQQIEKDEEAIVAVHISSSNLSRTISWKRSENAELVDGELNLLQHFFEMIEHLKPDVIYGRDIHRIFSMIEERASKYKIKIQLGVDYSGIKIRNSKAYIKGIPLIDIEDYAVRMLTSRSIISAGSKPDYEFFAELVPYFIEIQRAGFTLQESSQVSAKQVVEAFFINESFASQIAIPQKPTKNIIELRKQVYSSKKTIPTGIHENIALLPLGCVAASIISEKNISPETINCSCCAASAPRINFAEGNNCWLCKAKRGFYAKIAQETLSRYFRIKEMMKNSQQAGLQARAAILKIVIEMLSSYVNNPSSRWYSPESSQLLENATSSLFQDISNKLQNSGLNFIYANHDFMLYNYKDKNKAFDAAKIISELNSWIDVAKPHLFDNAAIIRI